MLSYFKTLNVGPAPSPCFKTRPPYFAVQYYYSLKTTELPVINSSPQTQSKLWLTTKKRGNVQRKRKSGF